MSEAKHTPGPWEWKQPYEGAHYYHLVAIGDYGVHPSGEKVYPMICDDGSAGDEYSPSIDVHGADAALIARAPELLAENTELLNENIALKNGYKAACAERDAMRGLLAELVGGIDRWNTAVAEIVDVSKVPKWQGLEDARAFLAGKKSQ